MKEALKLTVPAMNDPAIKRLQEAIDMLGFDGGLNDGYFNKETERAVKMVQNHLGILEDGVCGPITWSAIERNFSVGGAEKENEKDGIIDLRGTHRPPKLFGRKREWIEIEGVTLHQTGCTISNSTSRWKAMNAHLGITRDGKLLIINDPTDMIWHAQALSHSTIGIQICGNFQGIDGIKGTQCRGNDGPDKLNVEMLRAIEKAYQWILKQFKKNGQKWTHVYAHRQSSPLRIQDPGSEIWKKVGMEWLNRIGGTDGGPNWRSGRGRPIPKEWNPKYTKDY